MLRVTDMCANSSKAEYDVGPQKTLMKTAGIFSERIKNSSAYNLDRTRAPESPANR